MELEHLANVAAVSKLMDISSDGSSPANSPRHQRTILDTSPTVITIDDVEGAMASTRAPPPRQLSDITGETLKYLQHHLEYEDLALVPAGRHGLQPFYRYNRDVYRRLTTAQRLLASLLMHYLLYTILTQKQKRAKKDLESIHDIRRIPDNKYSTLPIIPDDISKASLETTLAGFSERAKLLMLRSISVAIKNIHDTYCPPMLTTIDLTDPSTLDLPHIGNLSDVMMALRAAWHADTGASPISRHTATPLRQLIPQQRLAAVSSHAEHVMHTLSNAVNEVRSTCTQDYERSFCVSLAYLLSQYLHGDMYATVHTRVCRAISMLGPIPHKSSASSSASETIESSASASAPASSSRTMTTSSSTSTSGGNIALFVEDVHLIQVESAVTRHIQLMEETLKYLRRMIAS